MRRISQWSLVVASALVLVLSVVPISIAVDDGDQGKPGITQQRGQRPGQRGAGQRGLQGRQLSAAERQRVRASARQSQMIGQCDQAAQQIRKQAGEMSRRAGGGGFNADAARAQRDQIRDRVNQMLRDHDQFRKNLSPDQQLLLRDRIRELDRSQDRVRDRLRELDAACAPSNPDPARVGRQAGELEQAMEQWHNRYRELAGEMGVRFEPKQR